MEALELICPVPNSQPAHRYGVPLSPTSLVQARHQLWLSPGVFALLPTALHVLMFLRLLPVTPTVTSAGTVEPLLVDREALEDSRAAFQFPKARHAGSTAYEEGSDDMWVNSERVVRALANYAIPALRSGTLPRIAETALGLPACPMVVERLNPATINKIRVVAIKVVRPHTTTRAAAVIHDWTISLRFLARANTNKAALGTRWTRLLQCGASYRRVIERHVGEMQENGLLHSR